MSEYEPAVNEVEVPVLNRDLCNQWLEHRDLNVTEGMICAGYPEGGKDACQVGLFRVTAVNEVEMSILNRDPCNRWLENCTEGMVCAGCLEGGKEACQVGLTRIRSC